MKIINLNLLGLKLLVPQIYFDDRGYFCECYRAPLYKKEGIEVDFIQDNHSFSKKGVIRGMHFQKNPGQAKLITVLEGKIFDVAVDIRPESPTFGKWEGVYLDDVRHEQLFVPAGFAHGFCVVSPKAHVLYKVSSLYDPLEEKTFRYDDPFVKIKWPLEDPILSERDKKAPLLNEVVV